MSKVTVTEGISATVSASAPFSDVPTDQSSALLADVAIRPDNPIMIDFEQVWLPQIVAYAGMIDNGSLEAQWRGRTPIATSVTDPDELHSQVFDDLDTDNIWLVESANAAMSGRLSVAVGRFLSSLRSLNGDVPAVLSSDAWADVEKTASAVVANVH